MAIVMHIVNTSSGDAREAYEKAWRLMEKRGIPRHPTGQRSHTAWLVDGVLHVLNVWDTEEDNDVFMQTLAPILEIRARTRRSARNAGAAANHLATTVRRDTRAGCSSSLSESWIARGWRPCLRWPLKGSRQSQNAEHAAKVEVCPRSTFAGGRQRR